MTIWARNGRRMGGAAALAAACAALSFALLGAAPAPNAGALGTDCGPHVDDTTSEATRKQLSRAIGCLINNERADRDRREVKPNRDLRRISKRHTRVMLAEDCFQHKCRGEKPLRKRIEASGYLEGGGRYGYGESLGCAATPETMMSVWMDPDSSSPFHKRNILDRKFRHFGIGVGKGVPRGSGCDDQSWATYTVIFGWRKRAN